MFSAVWILHTCNPVLNPEREYVYAERIDNQMNDKKYGLIILLPECKGIGEGNEEGKK